jgi:hypothetical protein
VAPTSLLASYTAAVCLILFTAIAGIDGLYFHIYRYRLFRRPASRYEHKLHTINAVLFVPLVAGLFCIAPSGLFLWLVLGLFALSFIVEILDVICEPASRRDLGGLTGSEYLMHFLMAALRVGAVAPLLVSTQAADWAIANTHLVQRPLWLFLLGAYIAGPGIFIAALHLYLARRGQSAVA